MNTPLTAVLLVEDNAAEAGRIKGALAESRDPAFRVEQVSSLSEAMAHLEITPVDVILLDLTLPDGRGIEVFDRISSAAPEALILILVETDDDEAVRVAVQRGAHDYFPKGSADGRWLPRALRYVIERKAIQRSLHDSEARFRTISDASPLGIFVSDREGECTYTNAAYHAISGLTFDEALGTRWSLAIHQEDRHRVLSEWRDAVRGAAPFQAEARFLRNDGSVVWTRLNAVAISDGSMSNGRIQIVEDITERKATELELRNSEMALFEEKERAQVTLNSIGDAVLSTDLDGNLTYLNLVAETMTGWSRQEASGRPLEEVFRIIDGETRQIAEDPARRAIRENRIVGLEHNCILVRRDGFESAIEDSSAPIHDRDGHVTGAVIVFHDVSAARSMAFKMEHLAQHDFLTGLPNRMLLAERLSRAIGLATRHGKKAALLYLDLDCFKNVNDSLGHAIGDQVLQSTAERLSAIVRDTDTVSRQGGDEFVILLSEIEQPEDAALIAEKLLAAFALPQLIAGHELHVSLSIGISVFPDDGADAETLMQNADTAMYHAKAGGRKSYQFFKSAMNRNAVQRQVVENSLRRALKHGEFYLHYQPQITFSSGEMTGAEALIRWRNPDLDIVSPAQFVPVAEESGLIVPMGRWVLREACRQVKSWLDSGLHAVPVAVNISAIEFSQKDFLLEVARILKETGLEPNYLELELTESVLMQNLESSTLVLNELMTMGVKLAIDDFGTGYSSLSYLKRFPIDTLKIDQSFVRDIAINGDDATIVSTIIAMGKSLNLRVVAEGVETNDQLCFLQKEHCIEGQGFLFSHPLLAEDFARLLVRQEPVALESID